MNDNQCNEQSNSNPARHHDHEEANGGNDPNAFALASLLHELTFWEATPKEFIHKSQSVNDISSKTTAIETLDSALSSNRRRRDSWSQADAGTASEALESSNEGAAAKQQEQMQQQQQQPLEPSRPDSPTLEELQAACPWHKAVDPSTGRTYYYEIETRQSQWDKPREIRAIEKRAKKEQRQRLEIFFGEMEANVMASLARGEVIPLVQRGSMAKEGPPLEPVPVVHDELGKSHSNARVRTISGMNEHLLAQLQQPWPHPSAGTAPNATATLSQPSLQRMSSSPSEKGRPPLPRPPPSSTTIHSMTSYIPPQNALNAVAPLPSQLPVQNVDITLPPDETEEERPMGDDSLRGEEFLDRILVDLEVSDDEDENDVDAATATGVALTTISGAPVATSAATATVDDAATRKADKNVGSHIRRNTAGNAHKAGTMDKPDIDGTIHVVCGVIRAHIEQSLHHHRSAPSPHAVHVNLDMFRDDYECLDVASSLRARRASHSAAIPSLEEIKSFYREFFKRSQMEFDAIIMSLIYVERLIKETNGALMPTPDNWGSVVFSCMVLASKVWDDLSMWNIDFSNVSVNSSLLSSFSLKRINQLELGILTCLNFAVTIPGSEYAKYYYLLRSMMIRGGLLDPFAANQPLSNAEQSRLEDRTNHYQECKLNQDDGARRRVRSVDWSQLQSTTSNGAVKASDSVAAGHHAVNLMVSGPVLREKLMEQRAV